MSSRQNLNDDLVAKIKKAIRNQCSPRHVPAIILETPEIPYTINGKKVEIAVRRIIAGLAVTNRDALVNPESLDFYHDISELKSS